MAGRVRPRAFMMNRVCVPLPAPGGTAQQDDLLGEPQVFVADFFLERFPDRVENHLGVFDFQVQGCRSVSLAKRMFGVLGVR